MKLNPIFVLIAVLTAGLLITGCPTDSDSGGGEKPASSPDTTVAIDKTVDNEAELRNAMDEPGVEVVALVLNNDTILNSLSTIPKGKTLYLLNPTGASANPVTRIVKPNPTGLNVRGKVIVSESVILAADKNARIYLWSDGSIQVQDRGTLRTDTRDSVSDYTDAGVGAVSVLTRNVNYGGGSTLTITNEDKLTVAEIGGILSAMSSGKDRSRAAAATTPTQLVLVAALSGIKPSEIGGIAGLSGGRRLSVRPAAAETATTLTIPPGADIETTVDLEKIETISISDATLSAPAAVFAALKEITVTGRAGELDAPAATIPALTKLTVSGGIVNTPQASPTNAVALTVESGAELTVTKIKGVEGSKIAGDSEFYGEPESGITFDPGASWNGVEITEETAKAKVRVLKATDTSGSTDANATTITVATGEYVQIPEKYYTSGITVSEGGILSVIGTLYVKKDTAPNGSFKGALIVETTGTLHDKTDGGGSILPKGNDTTATPGTIVFKTGSKGIRGDTTPTTVISPSGPIFIGENSTVTLKWEKTNSQMILNGTATVTASYPTASFEYVIIERNSILTVANGGAITGDGNITGQGTLIVEGTGKAPGVAYSLSDKLSDDSTVANPTGLNIASATKDLSTGVVTVKLGGTGGQGRRI
jgi:hypothetical protein